MQEVSKLSHPRLPEPTNPNNRLFYQEIEKSIIKYLTDYQEQLAKDGKNAFWDNSEIEKVFFSEEDNYMFPNFHPYLSTFLLHFVFKSTNNDS
jgi:hypothetical protein